MSDTEKEMLEAGIKSLHAKLEHYTYSTSSKLDNIIELAKQMAAIQERQQRHTDDISRLEIRVNNVEEQKAASIERIHKRLDTYSSNMDTKLSETILLFNSNLKDVSSEMKTLDEDYKANKNFVRGAMWVLVGAFVILQAVGLKYINDIQSQLTSRDAAIVRIEKGLQDIQNIVLYAAKKP